MALTPSTMHELGTSAPAFALPATDGRIVRLDDFDATPALLVAFICNHCPYVKHIRDGFVAFAREYQARGLAVVAISSNDASTHPDDSPEMMKVEADQYGFTFPYLYDETQEVAKAYRAACTPDFFLYDNTKGLVYRGQFDGSRPGNGVPVTGASLRDATDAVLSGAPVATDQFPSIGCNIKWRPGNEPSY
ncbi:MAG: thioredoxin family protein [Gammaproteobacteria bacterium]|nr:thioredoxin family protein [Gammaproteobacteria bacterium]NND37859.1 thioredoxin family protein [Gammaproteobacteria bacterium]